MNGFSVSAVFTRVLSQAGKELLFALPELMQGKTTVWIILQFGLCMQPPSLLENGRTGKSVCVAFLLVSCGYGIDRQLCQQAMA